MPRGLINRDERNPLDYTLNEYQQAKRKGRHADEIKADLHAAWAMSDTKAAFEHALQDKECRLARGDRLGFVVTDHEGEVYSLPRWLGVKTKAVRERLGCEQSLPDLETTQAAFARDMARKMDGFGDELKAQNQARLTARAEQGACLIECQRAERAEALKRIEERQIEEARNRQARFRSGLKGLWDWVRGENARIKRENEANAERALARDASEKEALIQRQREQRRFFLQCEIRKRDRIREQYQAVAEDRARFEAKANHSSDEQREAFKRSRRQAPKRPGPEGQER